MLMFARKEGYGVLAKKCAARSWCLYRVKPKLHLLEHFPKLGWTLAQISYAKGE